MIFEFGVNSRNAAFTGGKAINEVARLLRQTADRIEAGGGGGYMMDVNGNRCGSWLIDDQRPDLEGCDAEDLMQFADDFGVILEDDPRKLSRAELVEGLESIAVACYDDESDELLAAAYADSMLAGDLPGDCSGWRDACAEEWNA